MNASWAGRCRAIWLAALVALTGGTRGQEVQQPDSLISKSREEVIQWLGPMRGSAVFEKREILQFDRGLVELRDGKVVRADIITPEQLVERQAKDAAEREAAHRARLQQAARQKAEGEALIQQFKGDVNFASKPAAERLNIWREIAARYPESVNADMRALVLAAENEAEKNALEQRIAQLEFLAWEANRKAQAAQEEASRPKVIYHGYDPFFSRYYLNSYYGAVPYGRPWVRTTHPGSGGFYGVGGHHYESYRSGGGIYLKSRSGSFQSEINFNSRNLLRK